MTGYVCDTPYRGAFHLWADTPEEAEGYVWALGLVPAEVKRHELNSWDAYLVPAAALGEALVMGLELTDRFGPAMWCARRDGRLSLVETLERARRASA